jgi:hypothetical protein
MHEMTRFRSAALGWAVGGTAASTDVAAARALADELGVRVVVLVEGVSDQVAVETLAARRGLHLDEAGICVLPLGGATSIGKFLRIFGPPGLDLRLAGLCDAGEERFFARALEGVGVRENLTRAGMEQLGFYVCVDDLEDELIRSIGVAGVQRVMEEQGDLRSFRTLQRQPAQRSWTVEQQVRRFMGSIGGRKARYARALLTALGDAEAPRPLEQLVAHLAGLSRSS